MPLERLPSLMVRAIAEIEAMTARHRSCRDMGARPSTSSGRMPYSRGHASIGDVFGESTDHGVVP